MNHVLLIDNYDSFTYNIKNYCEILGAKVSIVKNDEIELADIDKIKPTHIVLSPGPGTPNDAGITLDVIRSCYRHYPILGVCLGHQSIAAAWGANIVRASQVMHGKNSMILHDGKGLFQGLPETFSVTRYHSLLIEPASLSDEFEVSAWAKSDDDTPVIMGLRHKFYPLFGVQYHPEAILSEHGYDIFKRFLSFSKWRSIKMSPLLQSSYLQYKLV